MVAQPKEMLIEVTNRCNYACIFCPHQTMKMKQGEIDPALLKRIMQEAYDMGIRRIGFYTTGEMFLCKEIATHIRNAKEIGFSYIYSDTNGALATKENMKKVLLAGLDSIKFSINAGTRETYQYIHGRDSFDKVLQNLKDCHSLKSELGLDFKLMVSCVTTNKAEEELEILKGLTEPYVDEFRMQGICVNRPSEPIDLSYLAPKKMEITKVHIPCSMVFDRVHITWDGYLTACCIDFDHDLLLADLKKMSLQEAWNCENAVNLRERHLRKDLKGTMCYNCLMDCYNVYSPLEV